MSVNLLKKLFYLCALFFVTAVNADEQIEFDINGLKIGDKLTEDFYNNYCPKKDGKTEELECKQELKINEIQVTALYFYYDATLISILLTYRSNLYNDLVKSYTKKFKHSPHKKIKELITLATGEKYSNEKASWVTTSGNLIIEKYGNNFSTGYVRLESNEYIKYLEEKKSSLTDSEIKKIFKKLKKYFKDFFN